MSDIDFLLRFSWNSIRERKCFAKWKDDCNASDEKISSVAVDLIKENESSECCFCSAMKKLLMNFADSKKVVAQKVIIKCCRNRKKVECAAGLPSIF